MQISPNYTRSLNCEYKKGTTILGMICENGNAIVIACDSRASAGHIVADKKAFKLHKLADNIYCGGAGTAADLTFASDFIQTKLSLHKLTTGRMPTVKTAVTLYKRHLFNYGGHIGCYLTLGGYDHEGAHLYVVDATGLAYQCMYYTEGSGRIGAQPILQNGWRIDLTKEEAMKLAVEAIEGGMFNDMGSGGVCNVCCIDKNGYEEHLEISNPSERQFRNPDFKGFPDKLEMVSCETITFDRDDDEIQENQERLMELE